MRHWALVGLAKEDFEVLGLGLRRGVFGGGVGNAKRLICLCGCVFCGFALTSKQQ
ncbi:hypothetical protein [Riemerella columbina]|uniref:hypothetical protein n=1 Tax=Riemerella columbina TaxID=103810 RepID=UPI00266EFD7C|nr:hypothetical protein [Riemerella columbina]WKS95107.1 hypothetical protein NYR17_09355 [Riemerella columbina]